METETCGVCGAGEQGCASAHSVGEIILAQLGGQGRLRAMTGAHSFVASEKGLGFKLPSGKAGGVVITLKPSDTYTVEFFHRSIRDIPPGGSIVKSTHEDIYCDALKGLIERQTGLYLSL